MGLIKEFNISFESLSVTNFKNSLLVLVVVAVQNFYIENSNLLELIKNFGAEERT